MSFEMKFVGIILLICGTFLSAQTKWRLTTDAEMKQEQSRSLGPGVVGDPPCTLGAFFGGAGWSIDEKDCGLTDGSGHFSRLIVVDLRRPTKNLAPYSIVWKRCQMSEEQYDKQADKDSFIRIEEVVERCRKNKLPRWP